MQQADVVTGGGMSEAQRKKELRGLKRLFLAEKGDPVLEGLIGKVYKIGRQIFGGRQKMLEKWKNKEIEEPWLLKYMRKLTRKFESIEISFNRRLGGPKLRGQR